MVSQIHLNNISVIRTKLIGGIHCEDVDTYGDEVNEILMISVFHGQTTIFIRSVPSDMSLLVSNCILMFHFSERAPSNEVLFKGYFFKNISTGARFEKFD